MKIWSYQEIKEFEHAVKSGDTLRVALYLQQDSNLVNHSIDGMHPIWLGISNEDLNLFSTLIQFNPWVEGLDESSNFGGPVDPYLLILGNLDVLSAVARWVGVDHVLGEQQTLLHIAAHYRYLEAMELLLKLGANPNSICGEKQGAETALHRTFFIHRHANTDPYDYVRLLIEYGADPSIKNINDVSCIDYITRAGDYEEKIVNLIKNNIR